MLKLTRPPPGAASLACRLLSSDQQVVTGNADQVHRYFAHSEYLLNDGGLRGAIEDWIALDNRTASISGLRGMPMRLNAVSTPGQNEGDGM